MRWLRGRPNPKEAETAVRESQERLEDRIADRPRIASVVEHVRAINERGGHFTISVEELFRGRPL